MNENQRINKHTIDKKSLNLVKNICQKLEADEVKIVKKPDLIFYIKNLIKLI